MRETRLDEIDEALENLTEQGWTTEHLLTLLFMRTEEHMAQIDELLAALANDQALTDTAVAMLQSLTGQVSALQVQLADLQAQLAAIGTPVDLQPAIDAANALGAELQAAEAPAPVEPPPPEPAPVEPPPEPAPVEPSPA